MKWRPGAGDKGEVRGGEERNRRGGKDKMAARNRRGGEGGRGREGDRDEGEGNPQRAGEGNGGRGREGGADKGKGGGERKREGWRLVGGLWGGVGGD